VTTQWRQPCYPFYFVLISNVLHLSESCAEYGRYLDATRTSPTS
jgi:hypothetical protein